MNNLLTLDEINATVSEKSEYLVIDKKDHIAVVFDRNILIKHGEERIKRIYHIEDDKFRLIDLSTIVQEVVEFVSAKVKVRELVDDIVRTTPPEILLEAFRRLRQPKLKAKAKTTNGCYGIEIPGNRGQRSIELILRP